VVPHASKSSFCGFLTVQSVDRDEGKLFLVGCAEKASSKSCDFTSPHNMRRISVAQGQCISMHKPYGHYLGFETTLGEDIVARVRAGQYC
jgi:hypothetical protein